MDNSVSRCYVTFCYTAAVAKSSRADYMRQYRAVMKPLSERSARQEGFDAGVRACAKFIRDFVGDRAFSGYRVALWMEKGVVSEDTPELAARRRLIQSLMPAGPQQQDS